MRINVVLQVNSRQISSWFRVTAHTGAKPAESPLVTSQSHPSRYCSAPSPATGGLPVTPSRSLGFGMVKVNQTTEL